MFTNGFALIIYHNLLIVVLCLALVFICNEFETGHFVLVSTAECLVGCGSLRMVGYAKYREVGRRCLVQEASTTVLEHFAMHAVNKC